MGAVSHLLKSRLVPEHAAPADEDPHQQSRAAFGDALHQAFPNDWEARGSKTITGLTAVAVSSCEALLKVS